MKIDVDMRRLKKKEAALIRALRVQGDKSVETLAELGRNHARMIAPKKTLTLQRHIVIRKTRDAQGNLAADIVAENPTAGGNNQLFPGTGKYAGKFDLVRWMHTTGGVFKTNNPFGRAGTKHIRSGDPKFMYSTRDYLKSVSKKVASGGYRKIQLR